VKNGNLVVKTSKLPLLTKFFKTCFNHHVDHNFKYEGSYVIIHPELLPPMIYSLYNNLLELQMYPSEYNNFNRLLTELKRYPYYSETDKHIILFLLISGNKFHPQDKDKLTNFIQETFPRFIDEVSQFNNIDEWLESFNPEPEILDFAVRGLLLIISNTCGFSLDFDLEEFDPIIYVQEKQLEQINHYWDCNCFPSLGVEFQVLPMPSLPVH
jgi:hypothetical protein